MFRLCTLIAVLILAGCAHIPSTPAPQVLTQMPDRMRELHPGMTAPQVRTLLGLRPGDLRENKGGGPTFHYRIAYEVGGGHSYIEAWDTTAKPARLVMVQFDSYSWSAPPSPQSLGITAPPGSAIPWDQAKTLILHGAVKSVDQNHHCGVGISLKDGTYYSTIEPEIDDVIHLVQDNGLKEKISIITE